MTRKSKPVMNLLEIAIVIAIGAFLGGTSPLWSPDGDTLTRTDIIVNTLVGVAFLWLGWYAIRATLRWRGILRKACERWGYTYKRKYMRSQAILTGVGQPLQIEWDARGGETGPPLVVSIEGGHRLTQGETGQNFLPSLTKMFLGDYTWEELQGDLWPGSVVKMGVLDPNKGVLRPKNAPDFASFRWQKGMGVALFDPLVYTAISQLISTTHLKESDEGIIWEMKTFVGPAMAPLANVICGLITRLIPWKREKQKELIKALQYNHGEENRLALFQEIIESKDPAGISAIVNWLLHPNQRASAAFLNRAVRLVSPHATQAEQQKLDTMVPQG